MPVEEFVRRAGPLKTRFTNDLHTKELIRDVLCEFGCDPNDTYFDVPRLRIVPAGGYLSSGVSYAYKAHRDIWYASPTAQVNWWMPVFDVTGERAMSFFGDYWAKTLPNSSADFDYGEWCSVGRKMASSQIKEDTRKHPLPVNDPDPASELRICGTKGDMIMFSASQLHATAPNDSPVTRFSIDFRTIALSDLASKRGAPNPGLARHRHHHRRLPARDRFRAHSQQQPVRSRGRSMGVRRSAPARSRQMRRYRRDLADHA